MCEGLEDLLWVVASAWRPPRPGPAGSDAWPAMHVDRAGRCRGTGIRLDDDGLHLLDGAVAIALAPAQRLRHVEAGRRLLRGPLLLGVDHARGVRFDASVWVGARPDARQALAVEAHDAARVAAAITRRFGAAPFPPPPPPTAGAGTPLGRLAAVLRPGPPG